MFEQQLHWPRNDEPACQPDAVEVLPSPERIQWDYIQLVLRDCNGNISLAARRLHMHRRTLQRKLAKLPPSV
jgi:two-component system response regulator RegA